MLWLATMLPGSRTRATTVPLLGAVSSVSARKRWLAPRLPARLQGEPALPQCLPCESLRTPCDRAALADSTPAAA